MTIFDDRERAFESRYALEQETEFLAIARRDRMLGEWAGALLGKSGADLAAYAAELVRADVAEAGDEDVVRRLTADLDGKAGETEIRAKLADLLEDARASVQAGA